MEYPLKEETYQILGACFEVHNNLGFGFLESVYQEALEIELTLQNIPFEREKVLNVFYKGVKLKKKFEADFLCFSSVVVELKAASALTSSDDGQLLNYLKATGIKIGLLVNFGEPSLKYRRLIF